MHTPNRGSGGKGPGSGGQRPPFTIVPGGTGLGGGLGGPTPAGNLAPPPKYDEGEFLVGGRGTGPGEVEQQSFRLHEGYIAEAYKLVESGAFVYDSKTDLYRHAVVRHIAWLFSLEPELIEGSAFYQIQQIGEIVAEEERNLRFAKSIDAINAVVQSNLALPGGRRYVSQLLRRMRTKIAKMSEGFWKRHYSKLFEERFSLYIDRGLVLLDPVPGEGGEDEEGSIPDDLFTAFGLDDTDATDEEL